VETAVSVAAVVLAAGSSSRMRGIKKEYQKLANGDTVLGSSVRAFSAVPSIHTIIIAIPKDDEAAARGALSPELLSAQRPKIFFVNGGDSRRASVFNALSFLESASYVLIHDGARPFVSSPLIEKIIEAVVKHEAVIPVLAITDTPKELEAGFVKRHLKRSDVGAAQTPQAFKFPEILHAHEKAAGVENEEFTDDAEIWGRFCGQVAVISGELENKKITFKEDLF